MILVSLVRWLFGWWMGGWLVGGWVGRLVGCLFIFLLGASFLILIHAGKMCRTILVWSLVSLVAGANETPVALGG